MAADGVRTTVLRRHIGRRMLDLRLKAHLTQQEAAKRLDRSRTTLIKIEDGDETVRFREVDVKAMLDLYAASDKEREILLTLTAETRNDKKKNWWHSWYTSSAMPGWFQLFVVLEDAAENIRGYESELVPGLLQTRSYAEELFRIGAIRRDDEAEIERLTAVRLERQRLLTRPRAPHLDVVLNEAVIRRQFGSATVMAEQLTHLCEMTRQSNVTIRIVPFDAGANGGAVAGSFYWLDFPEGRDGEPIEPPLAFVDTLAGSVYISEPDEVKAYRRLWADLERKALDPAASKELITAAMEGLTDD